MNSPTQSGDDLHTRLANDISGQYAEQTRLQLNGRAKHFEGMANQSNEQGIARQASQISAMFATAADVVGDLARKVRR